MINLVHFNRNIRSLRRYRQIVGVLIRYGFGFLLEQLNLGHFVERGRRILRRQENAFAELTPAQRMRLVFEELGPTFIKLGQLLSTRPDVIPPPYVEEFAKLQDRVLPLPYPVIRDEVERALGGSVGDIFSLIDEEPLAAASIAQVHRAALASGEEVVVKVRRPGIRELVETDIDVLMGLAHLMERHMPLSELFEPMALVKEFARTIRREMDLHREGRTIERFAESFRGVDYLSFPRVYWQATSESLLTMEYVPGIKSTDIAALEAAGLDRKLIARRGADAFLIQVLEHGFFHGDPHPGNVRILPGNRICLLDYGMVGHLESRQKRYISDLILAIVERDPDGVITLLQNSGDMGESVNLRALRRDLAAFIDDYYETPLRQLQVGRMLLDFTAIITTHRISLPPDLMLLIKALVNIEGMGRELDPDFDMIEHLRPYMERVVRERYSPSELSREIRSFLSSSFTLARNLPRDLREILARLNRNTFKIDLEHRGLDRFISELDRSVNRLSSSLILASLIVGSSIVMQVNQGPRLLGMPFLAVIGFAVAGFIGLWLVIAILRSGRL
ncbi:MAG TPA: AarF/UbiB family protein [Geobacterales bacterium]|nr:AarF/UbiB family protein [Geobacterales bacterium]